ncbi:MAG: CPBP family intramembrane metalloprotease [Treponema sp.]|jgi:membrane protease YdiL (CAAX protease family)|nr:CPBP family intramembrane metalloprotease [Treponema sp.]
MGIYIEALILYIVLFFSGAAGAVMSSAQAAEGFSITGELSKIFLYYIPSLALIWYLLFKVKPPAFWSIKPQKKDIIAGLVAFPCLLITGSVIAYISSFVGGDSAGVVMRSPSSITEWAILCLTCILAAYLEESFFRFYIISRMEEFNLGSVQALAVSSLLFSICHIYVGPWGFLNSLISAVILGFIFLRYKALHGIAIAHAFYNIAVYVINSFTSLSV